MLKISPFLAVLSRLPTPAYIVRVSGKGNEQRLPIIGLLDSGGARIQKVCSSLQGYGEIFRRWKGAGFGWV
jgi:acetyl-CoA carboxylase carboxyltransferase component